MTCECCGKEKPDVKMQHDPYRYELYNDKTEYALCDACVREGLHDI